MHNWFWQLYLIRLLLFIIEQCFEHKKKVSNETYFIFRNLHSSDREKVESSAEATRWTIAFFPSYVVMLFTLPQDPFSSKTANKGDQ